MPEFRRYTVHHIQLAALEHFVFPSTNTYLVCWHKKIPLGHLWLQASPGKEGSRPPIEWIENAISQSLNYYLATSGRDEKEWKSYLKTGNYAGLDEYMQSQHAGTSQNKNKESEKLSVIICTSNRPEALTQCLDKLLHSDDIDFELIVVDNCPLDTRTAELVNKIPSVKYILEERKGLDFARNAGLRAATGSVIAFTDDDVLVAQDWTSLIKQSFKNHLTLVVTGLVIASELETESQYFFEKNWSFNKGYIPIRFDRHFFNIHKQGVPVWMIGAGANMAFRREAFELAGEFDIRLGAGASGCSDDTEMWYRILAGGWNCEYLPSLIVYHRHRNSMKALKKQLLYYMRGLTCSLLIQYEKYQDKGNLLRLYKLLPKYYFARFRNRVIRGNKENVKLIFTEIRGFLAGIFYYWFRKKNPGYTLPFLLPSLPLLTAKQEANALVSVIIPCYNHAQYLSKAIESVLNQTHSNVEIIVVDDGSADDPAAVCRRYDAVKYVRVERVGVSAARNIGVRYSNGEFLVFLDADDFLYPDGVAWNLHYFTLHKEVAYVSGAHDKVNSEGRLLSSEKSLEREGNNYLSLLEGNYIGMEATVMYRRELFFCFHFDPQLKLGEDYDLNLNIARHFAVYGHTKKIAAYHIHQKNTSGDNNLMLNRTLDVLKRQEKSLKDRAEKKAYQDGMLNWTNYYQNIGK